MWLATLEQAAVERMSVFPGGGAGEPTYVGSRTNEKARLYLAFLYVGVWSLLGYRRDWPLMGQWLLWAFVTWLSWLMAAFAWSSVVGFRRERSLRRRCALAPHHVEGEIVAVEDDGPALTFEEITGSRSARSCRVATVREFLVRTDDGRLVRVSATPHALVWLAVPRTDEIRVGARVALHGHAHDAPLGPLAGNDGYRDAARGWVFDGTADAPLFVCAGSFEETKPARTPRVRVSSEGRASKSLEHEEVREDTRDAEIEERLAQVEVGVARVDLHQEVADA